MLIQPASRPRLNEGRGEGEQWQHIHRKTGWDEGKGSRRQQVTLICVFSYQNINSRSLILYNEAPLYICLEPTAIKDLQLCSKSMILKVRRYIYICIYIST